MSITIKQARPLCTKSELELVEWSTPKRVAELDATRLRQKVSRARKLRDKFRDLGDSQKRQIRGKEGRAARGGPAQDNRNTRTKQQLFAETVERFEAALARLEAGGTKKVTKKATTKQSGKKAGKKVGKKKVAKAASKKVAKKVSGKVETKSSKKVTKKVAKKVAKKAGKKATKKAGKKVSASAEAAASGPSVNKSGKKTSKKAAPRKASDLLAKKTTQGISAFSPAKKKSMQKILAAKETRQNNVALTTISEEVLPKVKSMAFSRGGAKRQQSHVASRERRVQAKRDSR